MKQRKRNLRAGGARRDITPPPGTPLTGFIARLQSSSGVADRIHTRAVTVRHGKSAIVIIQLDLIGLAFWQVAEIRRGCQSLLGIPPEHVLISCTHTHSGPGVVPIRGCEMASLEYQWSVIHETLQAVRTAHDRESGATIRIAAIPYRLGINRRQPTPDGTVILGVAPDRPAPKKLDVAVIRNDGGQTLYLFSHAAHPYVLGAESAQISGDFPSFACNELESNSSCAVALFINGCAGNIAPVSAFQGIERAREEGFRLAVAVRKAAGVAKLIRCLPIGGSSEYVHLEYQPLPTEREFRALLGKRERTVRPDERLNPSVGEKIRRAYSDWANALQEVRAGKSALVPVFAEIQLLRIGDLALIGISGEPFFEIGEHIRRASRFRHTWPAGYCNAFTGYLPTARAFREGGYEVNDAYRYLGTWQIEPSAEHKVVAAAKKLFAYGCP